MAVLGGAIKPASISMAATANASVGGRRRVCLACAMGLPKLRAISILAPSQGRSIPFQSVRRKSTFRTMPTTLSFRPKEDGVLAPRRESLAETKLGEDEVLEERRKDSGLSSAQLVFRKQQEGDRGFVPQGTTLHQSRQAAGQIGVVREARELRAKWNDARASNKTIGLVPTMGALHEGHLSLIRAAAAENDVVWVSIFVNPSQFGPTEDLATYPRTWSEDMQQLSALNDQLRTEGACGNIEIVFAPRVSTMYPGSNARDWRPERQSYVNIDESLTSILEGAARPTFFRGVATVVMKLLNLTRPDNVYFGQKDVQQLSVISRMVRDFMLDVRIKSVPIQRAAGDGLALSSRNVYLGPRRRGVALVLSRALRAAEAALHAGQYDRNSVVEAAMAVCQEELERQRALPPARRARFEVEYLSFAGFHDMKEIERATDVKTVVLSGTIAMLPLEDPQPGEQLGLGDDLRSVRLLDNIMWRNPVWLGSGSLSGSAAAASTTAAVSGAAALEEGKE